MNTQLLNRLIDYEQGDRHRIRHSLAATGFALVIADGEGLEDPQRRLLEAASLLHDVGIRPAMARYGTADGKKQEELGPAVVREILSDCGWTEEDIRRVAFLVGHHHTYTIPDDTLLQILIEADLLVNLDEGAFAGQTPAQLRDRLFRTGTGRALLDRLFP